MKVVGVCGCRRSQYTWVSHRFSSWLSQGDFGWGSNPMEMKKLVKERLCKCGDSAAAAVAGAAAIVHEVMVVVVVVSSAAGELRGAWRFHGFDDEERREPASCALPLPAYLFTAPAPTPKKNVGCAFQD